MSASTPEQAPPAATLRAKFDEATEFSVGIEEELLLLDSATLEPVPKASEVLGQLDGDRRFKLELPASQVEILTTPHPTATDAAAALMAARGDLAARLDAAVRIAGAGVSPLGPGRGELNQLPRYERIRQEYGPIAERQLVCALQVHVGVPGSERALAVYNHARAYLPLLAALAANGAFYEGRDTGLASVRPKLSELLPRQGIPPAFASWRQYGDALSWGTSTGTVPEPASWWWELRLHPTFGTLEFRVPDSQSTVAEAVAVASVAHALVVWLARRHDSGEELPVAESWRLEENRWSACRHGVEGEMFDPFTGQRSSTRQSLERLLGTLGAIAAELGAAGALERAATMVEVNGAIGQRQAAARGGAGAVAEWLIERFLEPWAG